MHIAVLSAAMQLRSMFDKATESKNILYLLLFIEWIICFATGNKKKQARRFGHLLFKFLPNAEACFPSPFTTLKRVTNTV